VLQFCFAKFRPAQFRAFDKYQNRTARFIATFRS
jgi:hypothetical protein